MLAQLLAMEYKFKSEIEIKENVNYIIYKIM